MRVIGTTRLVDRIRGAVRVEAVYDTDIDDLWKACTTPQRLARWIAEVSGDLPVGGTVHAVFTSTWAGPARVEVCDSPHHLLMTTDPGTDDETQLEAWLTEEALDRAHTGVPEHDGPLMSDRIRLDGTTVNAPDALAPAEFYATITDGIATGTSGWAAVTGPNALIAFQQVDDFRPPTWPSSSVLYADASGLSRRRPGGDWDAALVAGAMRLDFQPNSDHCFVYADPVGHPFCLSTWGLGGFVDGSQACAHLRPSGSS